jgi:hypothetical protein
VNGFSLHANTEIPAHRRDQLERLIRYTARGALSLERLEQDANGDLMYRFNRPWSDGTTGIKLSPLELLEKLAALVPLPRAHLGYVRDRLCWRTPKSRKFHPGYGFFERRELRKSQAERSALGIETGSPTVSGYV